MAVSLYFCLAAVIASARAQIYSPALPLASEFRGRALSPFKVPAPEAHGLFCILESCSYRYSTHQAEAFNDVSAASHPAQLCLQADRLAFILLTPPPTPSSFQLPGFAARLQTEVYVSGELHKTKYVATMHTLNATADLTTLTSVLTDFQAKKTWVWTDKKCLAEPFNEGEWPTIGSCYADAANVTKQQAGSIGPFPVQWWFNSDGIVNATLLSTQASNLTSLAQLVRFSYVSRDAHSDGFYVQEFVDFSAGPQPASQFVLPANCPQY